MEQDSQLESVLVADCGSTTTRVALIDLVADEFRLVARGQTATTVEVPWSRISTGVREAIRQVERSSGRLLLSEGGQLIVPEREDGSGVDGFVATVNAAMPLRVGVLGLIRDLSVDSLLKATDCSYITVESVVAKDRSAASGGDGGSIEAVLRDNLYGRLDAILLSGGIDGGASTPVLERAKDIAATLSFSEEGGRLHVVFAGNKDLRTGMVRILGDRSSLHIVDNVRPTLEQEELAGVEEELSRLYRDVKMGRVPGFGELKSWVAVPIVTTAEALGLVLRYLAQLYTLDVLSVDVGGSTTHLAGVIGGRYGSTISANLGVGYGIGKVLERAGIERLLGWLPFEMDPGEARNRIFNKGLRPMTVPECEEDLLLEQAAARTAIALSAEAARRTWLKGKTRLYEGLVPPVDLVIGRGALLAEAPSLGQAALVLLDGLQPTGVCTVALDRASLLPQLGALASVQPVAAAQTVARDGLFRLGTVISLTGTAREGTVALKLRVTYDDGRSLTVEVPYGSLEMIPLMAGRRATLDMRPGSQFDVGLGSKGKGATTKVEGGALGIVVDARGRPLTLPDNGDERRTKLRQWNAELGLQG
jgi:hypothetical protein